jgi:hypothetical protein
MNSQTTPCARLSVRRESNIQRAPAKLNTRKYSNKISEQNAKLEMCRLKLTPGLLNMGQISARDFRPALRFDCGLQLSFFFAGNE